MRDPQVKSNRVPFPIAGVGASAGGLEAFTELLSHLPVDTGMGFVLVQHLDPDHESALTNLLARATTMPVKQVTDEMRVEPDHVYVIPPNTNLAIEDGVLKLHPRSKKGGAHHSIDFFFESLAGDAKERAIGIILSGTAFDGTRGIEAIKGEGGIAFAQDATAKYDSMPRSAIAAGCVDLVLSPTGIASELARIARHPCVSLDKVDEEAEKGRPEPKKPGKPGVRDGAFRDILLWLRDHRGVDFSLYKPRTIERRISRRMILNKLETHEDYLQFLRNEPIELDALYSDVLIGVTGFFRNPEAFAALKQKVIPRLVERNRSEPIRMWVAGCSMGQEAYSLAIAFAEFFEVQGQSSSLQIFATDLNENLLNKARAGLYPRSLVNDVPPERLQRFFDEEQDGYRIKKDLRESVIFSRHNLVSDPPFSRMDLISCRNVMIYLESVLQQKVLPLFHYALKPDGFLFLGASESVRSFDNLFKPLDKKQRIFSRRPTPTPPLHRFAPGAPEGRAAATGTPSQPPDSASIESSAQREADRVTVKRYAPPGVLVDGNLHVTQFRGPTGAYLEPRSGKASFQVLDMARDGLMLPLRAAIDEAREKNQPVRKEGVRVFRHEECGNVTVEVIPLKNLKEPGYLILFDEGKGGDLIDESTAGSKEKQPGRKASTGEKDGGEDDRHIVELEKELADLRDYARSIQEQYEASTDELQASNEEVQSANEELQSINEELETSKEELESTNEELTTVNDEMASRNAELERLNTDLRNLQAELKKNEAELEKAYHFSEAIVNQVAPLLVLDKDLRVMQANEAFLEHFVVTLDDTKGRLVYELGNGQWDIPELRYALEQILPEQGKLREFEVDHDFEQIGPRILVLNATRLDHLQRILVNIRDVTARRTAERELKELNNTLEQRVSERTAEIEKRVEQLRTVSMELAETEQRERRRLALILHDDLQQLLVAAKMQIGAAVGAKGTPEKAATVSDLIEQAIASTRSLSKELAPPVLNDRGLCAALDWLAGWAWDRYGLRVKVEADKEAEPKNLGLRSFFFEEARELLLNVAKHAGTEQAWITLKRRDGMLSLEIEDFGKGFAPADVEVRDDGESGFGLESLKDRLLLMGGEVIVDSTPGQGTRVQMLAPVLE